MTIDVEVGTDAAMRALGARLGAAAQPGDCLLLDGPLGAGKTTLVQGLAVGLGVNAPVSSPTFVIETQYEGRLPLYHVDLYRLDRVEPELWLSLEEHIFGSGVTAIEWPSRLAAELTAGLTHVWLEVDGDAAGRLVRFDSLAPHLYAALTAP